jgi:hypothetical protein
VQELQENAHFASGYYSPFYPRDQILTAVLGTSPDTDLGPAASHRDPLPVYYDAQVISFIKFDL